MRPIPWSTAPAPSSTLLRFLRSQSESVCFFTANPRSASSGRRREFFDYPSPTIFDCASNPPPQANRFPSSARGLSTTTRRTATVEASILNLDCLFSRTRPSSSSSLQPPSRPPPVWLIRHRDFYNNQHARRPLSESFSWRAQSLLGGLSSGRKSKRKNTWKPDDLPPLASFLGDSSTDNTTSMLSLGRTPAPNKAANELKLRCTEFDECGNVTLVNGEFKKSELIAKVSHTLSASHI